MITIIQGVIQLILLILSAWMNANSDKKKKQEAAIKELKDAISTGSTSDITAILSGMR